MVVARLGTNPIRRTLEGCQNRGSARPLRACRIGGTHARGASGDDPGLPSVTPCGVGMAGAAWCCNKADPVVDWAQSCHGLLGRATEPRGHPRTRGWHGIPTDSCRAGQ